MMKKANRERKNLCKKRAQFCCYYAGLAVICGPKMIQARKGHPLNLWERPLQRIKRRLEERRTFASAQQEDVRLEGFVIGECVGGFAYHDHIVMLGRNERSDGNVIPFGSIHKAHAEGE